MLQYTSCCYLQYVSCYCLQYAPCLFRVLWLLLLLLGLGFFVYQMYKAISYYRSWPVSVNIDIKYNDTIQFPAVTLCNQNAFRSVDVSLDWISCYTYDHRRACVNRTTVHSKH